MDNSDYVDYDDIEIGEYLETFKQYIEKQKRDLENEIEDMRDLSDLSSNITETTIILDVPPENKIYMDVWNTKVKCDCGRMVLKSNMPQHKKTKKCIKIRDLIYKKKASLIPYLELLEKYATDKNLDYLDKKYMIDAVRRKIDNILI